MPDCAYCEETFGTEEAYLDHLREAHADELGPIDRRRVEEGSRFGDLPAGPIALVAVIGVAGAIVAYTVLFAGGGAGSDGRPHSVGSVHYHGTIEVVIGGQPLDFSRARFQRPGESPAFHFEGGDGSQWHVHAQGVTLRYAMATLGINVTEGQVTFEGTTYRASDPDATVVIEVNGNPVVPGEYVLKQGDHIRIVARSG